MRNLSGLMDRRGRIEAKPEGQQNNGQPAKGWEPIWSGAAGKQDEEQASETQSGKQMVATGRTIWTIRYQPGITPMMRFVDESASPEVIYDIVGITEVGRREALTLQTKRTNV
ncbi:head-tail adaptor protein [Spirosoma sp.]|uniref:phage head completion protein n=1 Tax=Spirosoma sp. TaxID=1899569 RepID=UPI003B3AA2D6